MTERINRADLDRIVATINDGLKKNLRLEVQGRNGYTGLDLYRDKDLVDTLYVGTKREVYTYLQGMRRAHLLSRPSV